MCAEDVTDRDAFCDKLVRLNKLGDPSLFTMRVVRLIGRKSNVKVVIEVDPVTFKQIMDKGHVYVGWKRCNVRESFHIIRCFKCCKYGHLSKNCENSVICPKCSKNHSLADCKADIFSCINCIENNSKLKTNYDINHTVFDNCCSSYKKVIDISKSMTVYNNE